VCHDGRQGRPKHKLSVRLKIEGNIEKKILDSNNSVKQQTIFEITTITTCILKKISTNQQNRKF
jgi:hypothetical protein